jgi:nucleoid DNA-binding protein
MKTARCRVHTLRAPVHTPLLASSFAQAMSLKASALYHDVASEAKANASTVKAVLAAVRTVVARRVRDGVVKVPAIATFKLRTVSARPATKKMVFGKYKRVSAQPERRALRVTASKQLKDVALT